MGTQHVNKTTYALTISGLVNNSVQLTYEDIITKNQLYKKVVTIYCVEGWQATILWEGILVKDLLDQVEPESNATTVIFHASDGYTTALPKDYIIENNIIIAYKMNGLILPSERGFPFQLVAESKYGYKWIKWITEIELSNSTDYLGYWESRGYSNNADIP
jgi:DMSO/TMAO reductase YedYZ molybdopterin-dependent catalytic subunit